MLTSKKALELLKKDVIQYDDELNVYKNRWLLHCLYVGLASKTIASELDLDEDYAYALGLIHDIGRKINHPNHVIEGYKYMLENGFSKEASICLTHSFIDNDINLVAGGVPANDKDIEFIYYYLKTKELSIYDNIVQLCDLICLESGFTTLEKRLLDIYTRKGVDINTSSHIDAAFALKNRIEKLINVNLYVLLDIDSSDLLNIQKHYEELQKLKKINH